ncbi:hypothetical protein LCGC14_0791480 [marine sediment metagenome]|uniref:Transposase n=1 Tax=marine sediment metagenome TaxID=412755 RepID=A0A0F9PSI7_9ZZZZ
MKTSRFSDSQIMAILKQAEGGMDTSMIKRMKELEDENRRLKKMYAEERLKSELRKEALEGKW